MQAYITAAGQCLPGPPIGNDRMADFIGHLSDQSNRLGRLTLRQNGIRTRHYAIRPTAAATGPSPSSAGRAVATCSTTPRSIPRPIGFLATATTQNDLLVPGLASGVHAEFGLPPLELASLQSVCASSMMALKAAALQVAAGEHAPRSASVPNSPAAISGPAIIATRRRCSADGTLPGDAEFLRWTLSDGAAARADRGSARRATACRSASTGSRCARSPTASRRA